MTLQNISAGRDVPNLFHVIIEIPAESGSVKYEVDKSTGLLTVDRFMSVAMHYPCNYGFVPNTLAGDGDPVDVLVYTPYPLFPGSLIEARPIGLLAMTDESGKDSKILALPTEKACLQFAKMQSLQDIPEIFLKKIVHFFEQYKALEPNKWVKIEGWKGVDAAKEELVNGVERFSGQTL